MENISEDIGEEVIFKLRKLIELLEEKFKRNKLDRVENKLDRFIRDGKE